MFMDMAMLVETQVKDDHRKKKPLTFKTIVRCNSSPLTLSLTGGNGRQHREERLQRCRIHFSREGGDQEGGEIPEEIPEGMCSFLVMCC